MIVVTCPACRTRYQVEEEALRRPAGRTVRCAHCGHTWREAPAPVAVPPGPARSMIDTPRASPPPAAPMRREPVALPPRRSRAGGAFGLLVVVLVLIVVAGIVARGEIVSAWPAAAWLYDLVGLSVP